MSSSYTNDFHHHLPSSSSDQHRRLSVNNGIHIRQPVSAVTSTSTVVAGQLPFRFPASSSADSPSSLPRAVISSNDTTFSSSLDVDSQMALPPPARSSGRHLPYQFSFTAQPTTATTQPPRNSGLSAASEFAAQYINTSPLQHLGANTFPFSQSASSSSNNAVSAPSGGNYLLGTPRSAASTSSSSFGTTPSSFTSDSFSAASPTHHSGTDAAADAYPSYNNMSTASHSLPSTNALQSSSVASPVAASSMPVSWAGPSSAPPASATWDAYIAPDEMMIGSPGMAGFYAGMSGLGIDGNVKRHDSMGTISPRDVLMGSATVIDNDEFSNAGSPTAAAISRDYPAVGGFGGQRSISSSYPGYSSAAADYSLDLAFNGVSNSPLMFSGYSNSLYSPQFSTAVPPHPQQSPPMDMVTQFNLELDGDLAKPTLIDANKTPHATAMSFDTSSPTNTIRGPKKSTKPELVVAIDNAFSVKFENGNTPTGPWPLPSRSLRKATKVFDEDAVDEEDEDDDDEDNADDDDYVDEPQHHGAGPHRTARRMSATGGTPTTPTSNPKPRRPSPYSRSSRPSSNNVRRLSHPASEKDRPSAATLTPKKVKSVKWESTKPKYWIPEGFDPWWDQKSRGRGVATVSSSAPSSFDAVGSDNFVNDGTFVDSSAAWPPNYLPDDWRELVRGKGNPARPFVCPAVNCGKTFQRSEHAKRHAWSLHTPDAVKVSCPFEGCDHKSTRGDNLKQHIGSHKRKSGSAAALRRRSEGGANGARRKVKYEEEGDDDEAGQWA
ncbi:hypothetical protein FRC00_010865 [Tulasnella sp. 408]|nr:hypothetical protein FRC00_010865 [Tulasnella sp. 408]